MSNWSIPLSTVRAIVPIHFGDICVVYIPGATESHVLELVCYSDCLYLLCLMCNYNNLVIDDFSFARVEELIGKIGIILIDEMGIYNTSNGDLVVFVLILNEDERNSIIFDCIFYLAFCNYCNIVRIVVFCDL